MSNVKRLGPGRVLLQRARQHASLSVLFRVAEPSATPTPSVTQPQVGRPIPEESAVTKSLAPSDPPAVQVVQRAGATSPAPPQPTRPVRSPEGQSPSPPPSVQREATPQADTAVSGPPQQAVQKKPVEDSGTPAQTLPSPSSQTLQQPQPPQAPQQFTEPAPDLPRRERVLRAISNLHRRKREERGGQQMSWEQVKQRAQSQAPKPGQWVQRKSAQQRPSSAQRSTQNVPDAPPPRRPRPQISYVSREEQSSPASQSAAPAESASPGERKPVQRQSNVAPAPAEGSPASAVQRTEAPPAHPQPQAPDPQASPVSQASLAQTETPPEVQREPAARSPAGSPQTTAEQPTQPSQPSPEPSSRAQTRETSTQETADTAVQRTTVDDAAGSPPQPDVTADAPSPPPVQRDSEPDTEMGEASADSPPVPLEQAWSVERVDRIIDSPAAQPSTETPPPPTQTETTPTRYHDPEGEVRLSQVLRQVDSGQPTASSIELVPPRRPRPTPPRPQADAQRQEAPSTLDTPDQIGGSPPAPTGQETADTAMRETAESPPPPPENVPQESRMVQTDIGPLPSDLWDLVGEQPPDVGPRADAGSQEMEQPMRQVDDAADRGAFDAAAARAESSSAPPVQRQPSTTPETPDMPPPPSAPPVPPSAPPTPPRVIRKTQADTLPQARQRAVQRQASDGPQATAESGESGESGEATEGSGMDLPQMMESDLLTRAPLADEELDLDEGMGETAVSPPEDTTPPPPGPGAVGPEPPTPPTENQPAVGLEDTAQEADETITQTDTLITYAEEGTASAQTGDAVPLTTKREGQPHEEMTLYADADQVQGLAEKTAASAPADAVTAFLSEQAAESQVDAVAQMTAKPENEEASALLYMDQSKVDHLLIEAEQQDQDGVLPMFADEADAESEVGASVPLLVQIQNEEETYIIYASADRVDEFLAAAEQEDREGILLSYADEAIAAETIDTPAPVIMQQVGEQEKFVVYASSEDVAELVALAEAVERGATAVVYGEEDGAEQDVDNPTPIYLKRPDAPDILVAYADETALETLLETADILEPSDIVDTLSRQVYLALRHRLKTERERMR